MQLCTFAKVFNTFPSEKLSTAIRSPNIIYGRFYLNMKIDTDDARYHYCLSEVKAPPRSSTTFRRRLPHNRATP
jgi:hypothetical protein